MGSVKDLTVVITPTPDRMGFGQFNFSNRYSVFDWGEMPDHIPNKGASLAMMSAYFFERCQKRGVASHYLGLGDNIDHPYSTDDATEPMNVMQIELARVIKPTPIVKDGKIIDYDYSVFNDPSLANFVVPMELIYRNTAPKGSSVFRRLKEGSLSVKSMGLKEHPVEGEAFPSPVLDISTKYEKFDRYPDERKGENRMAFMRGLAGLSLSEVEEAEYMMGEANAVITEGISNARLRNDDGKGELIIVVGRKLKFGDTLGTLDECRFTYPLDGQWVEVSKEIPRQWYAIKQPDWKAQIDAAKKTGAEDWKSLVTIQPKPLPPQLVEMISRVFTSTANDVLQRNLFDAPQLGEVVKEYKRFRELEMS